MNTIYYEAIIDNTVMLNNIYESTYVKYIVYIICVYQ